MRSIITAENIQYPHLRHALVPLKPSTKSEKSPANTIIPTKMNNTFKNNENIKTEI